ncbi:MAG TPA: hypothetical protein VMB91_12575 [Solirubrobacteraceae bacterium]|nr:hypothetical protein [Solirubrobacteraceae bacterium]
MSSGDIPAGERHGSVADGELVDAVPVLGEELQAAPGEGSGALLRRYGAATPAVQAAAAAAGGFVAGAAVIGLVHRRQRRAAALARGQRRRRVGRRGDSGGGVGELIQIVGSRSLLVDVHLLGGPGGAR